MHPEVKDLEIFKKASYSLYLQIIYKELIYVIERNYPELLIESEKRYEILSWGGYRWSTHFTLVQINIL